jgi:16S rRNA (guanine(966)-N(2))-methyltransferase RsmD
MNQLRGHLQDSVVLDLFAGVGTMGLEAISRGAKTAIMVEKDRKIFPILEENIKNLECSSQAIALQADALSSIPLLRVPRPVDVAFIDPPYMMMSRESLRTRILEQTANIEPLLSSDGFIVLRTPINPNTIHHSIEQLEGPEIHKEGSGMWILFYGKKVPA